MSATSGQLRLMHGDVEQKLVFLKQRVQRLCVIRMHGAETVLNDAPRKPVARRVNDGVPAARVQFLHQRAVNVDEYGVKRRGIEKIGHETAADTSRAPHNQCARHDLCVLQQEAVLRVAERAIVAAPPF